MATFCQCFINTSINDQPSLKYDVLPINLISDDVSPRGTVFVAGLDLLMPKK